MKLLQFSAICVAFAAMATTFQSCNSGCTKGSGTLTSETRAGGTFSKLEISGPFELILKQDSINSVKVTADDNLMKQVKTDVSGDYLNIKTDGSICASQPVKIYLGIKNLASIKTSGEVSLASDGKITTKDLELNLSGLTKIKFDVNADNVETTVSGSADINLTGQAASHKINFSGAGAVNALNFVVGKYEIQSSGSAAFKINVLNELEVNSSGVSTVEYRGNPKKVSNDKSGVGSIKKIE